METAIAEKALSVTDSIFAVLLIGVLGFCVWLIKYNFKQHDKRDQRNDEREKRYIEVIDTQAKGLQKLESIDENIKKLMELQRR